MIAGPETTTTPPSSLAPVLAITSGKGGVGKSCIAVNLAIQLARLGERVLLVDADLGLAKLSILLNIVPKYTLEDVIGGACSVSEAQILGPEGVTILPTSSGTGGSGELTAEEMDRLRERLVEWERSFDRVLLDTGAGLSSKVTDFACSADEAMVVTTPEPTAIADAYAMMKVMAGRTPRIGLGLLINRVQSASQAQDLYDKFARITERFLGFRMRDMGWISEDAHVARAVYAQIPLVVGSPDAQATEDVARLAQTMREQAAWPHSELHLPFFERWMAA